MTCPTNYKFILTSVYNQWNNTDPSNSIYEAACLFGAILYVLENRTSIPSTHPYCEAMPQLCPLVNEYPASAMSSMVSGLKSLLYPNIYPSENLQSEEFSQLGLILSNSTCLNLVFGEYAIYANNLYNLTINTPSDRGPNLSTDFDQWSIVYSFYLILSKLSSGTNTSMDLVPNWTIGAWVYANFPGSLNQNSSINNTKDNGVQNFLNTINQYNQMAQQNSQINMIYPYGGDLVLPWVSKTWCENLDEITYLADTSEYSLVIDNEVQNKINNTSLKLSYFYDPTVSKCVEMPSVSIVIDGRIDDGYLQDLNSLESESPQDYLNSSQMQFLADLIPQTINSSNTNGIQLDLEPYDQNNINQQIFYKELSAKLVLNQQYFSIFTFPKAMDQTTADILNQNNNGYLIISLYDLVDGAPSWSAGSTFDTSNTPAPVTVSSSGDGCNPPPTLNAEYSSSIPHSVAGYQQAVQLTVEQTIERAAKYNIKYKFAIPVSASVHEFETWGDYDCTFSDLDPSKISNRKNDENPNFAACIQDKARKNFTTNQQVDYVNAAIQGIVAGISSQIKAGNFNAGTQMLFRGVDLYGFNKIAIWTPAPPIVDYNTGNVFYGNTDAFVDIGNGASYSAIKSPYIYTTPGVPSQASLSAIAQGMQNIYNFRTGPL